MKIILKIILLIFYFKFFHLITTEIYFKSFECFATEECKKFEVYPNFTCFVNQINRKNSSLNLYAMFRKPLNKFYVRKCFLSFHVTSKNQEIAIKNSLIFFT